MSKNNSSRKTGSHMSIHGDLTQGLYSGVSKSKTFAAEGKRRCLGCMELYPEEYDVCPNCGFTVGAEVENALHMYPGTILHDKYVIGKVIGYGGFGVTYLAWDTVLENKVAIKEYLPSEFSTRAAGQTQVTVFSGDKTKQFNDGLEKFVAEAKRLAKFRNENGIVKIFDSFNEHGTAYIAMEYLCGETLAERLEREKTIPVEESIQLLMPIIESLNRVHDEGIIHRDIAPDNIFLTDKGEVKLIDFGASRYATTSRSRSLTVIIKPGYSAEEQYRSRGDQGSHTDVYSVGACLYRMVTGQTPPDAMERRAQLEKNHKDMLIPIKKFVKDIDPKRENAIYNAMNVRIEDRTPDMISLAGELLSEEPVKRRRSGIKKIDPLTWPLWAKIGIPAALSCVIVLSVLLGFGVIGPKSKLRNDYYVPDGYVLVPNVVSTKFEKAEKKLDSINLLPQIADKRTSDAIPRGTVLTQDPDAFNVVLNGSAVDLVYCDGHGIGYVPDVVGLELDQAKSEIENAGFVVKIIEKESTLIAPGCVISQNYGPNDENGGALEKSSEVELVVSIGGRKIDKTVEVIIPNFVGLKYDEAEKRINDLKLYVKQQFVYNAGIPVDEIVGQNPPEKTVGHQGDTVKLIVNRGELMQKMPDVTMMESSVAEATLKELGLDVYIKLEENDRYKAGVVFAQSVKSGTDVKTGTKVTLTVSEGKTVIVPDVVGSKQSAAKKALTDAGLAVSVNMKKDSSVEKGTVISQSEAAGTKLKQGEKVTIVVSSGNENANDDNTQVELLSITIERKPDKRSYKPGEKIVTTGMKVVASYSNGGERDVTNSCTLSETEAQGTGSMQIKVTYSENGVNKTASYSVTIEKLSLTLDKTSVSLKVGNSETLKANSNVSNGDITWKSSDSRVATVSSGGVVKAVKEGSTTITAKITAYGQTASATCSVDVSNTAIEVKEIVISQTTLSLNEGSSGRLSATVEPANATNGNIVWSSSNPSVATVTANGVVTAVKEGEAKITATAGGKSVVCVVTVKELPVKSIEVKIENQSSQKYSVGEKFEPRGLKVLAHLEAGSKDVTNACKYTLSGDINKTGEKTVTVEYKSKKTTYKVIYLPPVLSVNTSSIEITVGQDKIVSVTSKYKVTWKSSNTSIAKITANGYEATVTGVAAGKTTITVSNGYNSESISVVVKAAEVKATSATAAALDGTYYIGDEIPLSKIEYTVKFSNGKSEKIQVTNASTKTVTAQVVKDGYIKVKNGAYPEAKCKITAKTPEIKLNNSSLTLYTYGSKSNMEKTLKCDCSPSNVTVVWKTSDVRIASVNGGKVTAVGKGDATITASFEYKGNEYSAECKVAVKGDEAKKVTDLSVTVNNANDLYQGDDLNLTVTAKYSNDTSEKVTDYEISGYKKEKSGNQSVKVSYGGITKDVSVNVEAVELIIEGDTIISTDITGRANIINDPPRGGKWKNIRWTIDNGTGVILGENTTSSVVEYIVNPAKIEPTNIKCSADFNGITFDSIINVDVSLGEIKEITVVNQKDGYLTNSTSGGSKIVFDKLPKANQVLQEVMLKVIFKNGDPITFQASQSDATCDVQNGGNGNALVTIYYQGKSDEFMIAYEIPTTSAPTTSAPKVSKITVVNKDKDGYLTNSTSGGSRIVFDKLPTAKDVLPKVMLEVTFTDKHTETFSAGQSNATCEVRDGKDGSAFVTIKYQGKADEFMIAYEIPTTSAPKVSKIRVVNQKDGYLTNSTSGGSRIVFDKLPTEKEVLQKVTLEVTFTDEHTETFSARQSDATCEVQDGRNGYAFVTIKYQGKADEFMIEYEETATYS